MSIKEKDKMSLGDKIAKHILTKGEGIMPHGKYNMHITTKTEFIKKYAMITYGPDTNDGNSYSLLFTFDAEVPLNVYRKFYNSFEKNVCSNDFVDYIIVNCKELNEYKYPYKPYLVSYDKKKELIYIKYCKDCQGQNISVS